MITKSPYRQIIFLPLNFLISISSVLFIFINSMLLIIITNISRGKRCSRSRLKRNFLNLLIYCKVITKLHPSPVRIEGTSTFSIRSWVSYLVQVSQNHLVLINKILILQLIDHSKPHPKFHKPLAKLSFNLYSTPN